MSRAGRPVSTPSGVIRTISPGPEVADRLVPQVRQGAGLERDGEGTVLAADDHGRAAQPIARRVDARRR